MPASMQQLQSPLHWLYQGAEADDAWPCRAGQLLEPMHRSYRISTHLPQGILAHCGIQWLGLSMAQGLLVAGADDSQGHVSCSCVFAECADEASQLLLW